MYKRTCLGEFIALQDISNSKVILSKGDRIIIYLDVYIENFNIRYVICDRLTNVSILQFGHNDNIIEFFKNNKIIRKEKINNLLNK